MACRSRELQALAEVAQSGALTVVIDQAVLLVSDLSAEKSVPYVNAVLDRVAGLAQHIRAAERAVSSLEGPDDTGGPDVSQTTSDDPGTGAAG